MLLGSDYCAADLRGTVTYDRTITLRLGVKRRGMKRFCSFGYKSVSCSAARKFALDSKKRSLSKPTQSTLR